MQKNKKNINYGKIKRKLLLRDGAYDGRFRNKVIVPKNYKKEKHKINYLNND